MAGTLQSKHAKFDADSLFTETGWDRFVMDSRHVWGGVHFFRIIPLGVGRAGVREFFRDAFLLSTVEIREQALNDQPHPRIRMSFDAPYAGNRLFGWLPNRPFMRRKDMVVENDFRAVGGVSPLAAPSARRQLTRPRSKRVQVLMPLGTVRYEFTYQQLDGGGQAKDARRAFLSKSWSAARLLRIVERPFTHSNSPDGGVEHEPSSNPSGGQTGSGVRHAAPGAVEADQ